MYISKKWWAKAENYKWFARNYPNAGFSEEAAYAMYDYESTGNGFVNHYDTVDGMVNGYALGKHLQDLQLITIGCIRRLNRTSWPDIWRMVMFITSSIYGFSLVTIGT